MPVLGRAKNESTYCSILLLASLSIATAVTASACGGMSDTKQEPSDPRWATFAAARIDQCMSELRAVAPNSGAYVSESNYFEKNFQQAYWGSNYPRLLEIKKKYDPSNVLRLNQNIKPDSAPTVND